jgi:uncharacterized protein (TIGR03067 family)
MEVEAMRKWRFVPMWMVLLTPLTTGGEEKVAAELETLQGEWKVISLEHEAHAIPVMDGWGWTITGTEVQLKYAPTPANASLVVDPKQSPKALDLTALEGRDKGKVSLCIYKFEADRLIVCARIPSSKKGRPTEFKTEPRSESGLITLERVKGK